VVGLLFLFVLVFVRLIGFRPVFEEEEDEDEEEDTGEPRPDPIKPPGDETGWPCVAFRR
jgi:hypothetical protein